MNLGRCIPLEVATDVDKDPGGVASTPNRALCLALNFFERMCFSSMCVQIQVYFYSVRVGVALCTAEPCPCATLL